MKAKAELLPQASVVATLLGFSSLVHCSGPTPSLPFGLQRKPSYQRHSSSRSVFTKWWAAAIPALSL